MIYHLANCDNSGFVVVTVIHHALLCIVAIRAIRLEKDLAVFFANMIEGRRDIV